MDKKIFVIHHNGDNDGLMSGTIAYQNYRKEIEEGSVVLRGYDYELHADWMDEVRDLVDEGKQVLLQFVDITPAVEWFELNRNEINDGLIEIQIFDHHEKRYNDIISLKLPIDYHFSVEWCGSKIYLDWWKQQFNGNLANNKNVSKVFASFVDEYEKYVDAWDTWKFVQMRGKEHDILAFNETLMTVHDVESFNNVLMKRSLSSILRQGYYIIDFKIRNNIPGMLKNAMVCDLKLEELKDITNLPILLIQGSPSYYSEIFIKEVLKDKKFLILFYNMDYKNDVVHLSVRNSVKGSFDCAEIAYRFNSNGGGHRDAAGTDVEVSYFLAILQQAMEQSMLPENKKLIEELPVAGMDAKIIQDFLLYKNLNEYGVKSLD